MKPKDRQAEKRGRLTVPFNTGELKFEVVIKDTRRAFGRTEYLITPIAGSGECWKSSDVELLD